MEEQEKTAAMGGTKPNKSKYALILIHGRGASGNGMLSLASHLNLQAATVVAPQAPGDSWYPESFLAPIEDNQPELDRALNIIDEQVKSLNEKGFANSSILFCGFSQGACLTLEYTSRHADRYAGIIAFTGGLIGPSLIPERYKGNFKQTPVLITTSDPDFHVPLARVKESRNQIEYLNGTVTLVAFPRKPHSISNEEIKLANELIVDPLG
jgi:phospholipase/carboxylesterase